MSGDPVFDDENPEWTESDFARALSYEQMPPELLAAFPNGVWRSLQVDKNVDASAPSITMMVRAQSAGAINARLAA